MKLDVRASTRRSERHARNQDRAVIGGSVIGDARDVVIEHCTGPTLIAVLDGLGGHAAGEIASQMAGESLATADVPTDEATAEELLRATDRRLHAAGRDDPTRAGMGTTAALLATGSNGDEAVVASVGDSSVWRLTREGLEQLLDSDRAFGSTILQCLGANELGIHPHVRRVALEPGDRLLLASDGLTDVIGTDAIASVLREAPSGAVEQLLQTVEAAGPPDDVTVVVIDVISL